MERAGGWPHTDLEGLPGLRGAGGITCAVASGWGASPRSYPLSGPSTSSGWDESGMLRSRKESYEAPFKEPAGAPRPMVTGKGHRWRFSPQNNDISRIKEKVKIFL